MATSPQRLLATTFVTDTLMQEVHRLLSSEHVRSLLDELDKHTPGLTARWVDVHIVGETGSSKTAYEILKRLSEAGWVTQVQGSKPQVWKLSAKGRQALDYARAGDSLEK
ncbi:MAG: hypothetical protein WB778_05200 [Thermoplasmata archaeon]